MEKPKFTCKYCHKVFVIESAYMKHKCKQMKREEELQSLDGQLAWEYYQVWMKYKNRMPPSASSFLSSNYFKTFFKFVDFCRQVKLPLPNKFIRFMVHKDYHPTMWTNDDVYIQYIDFLDACGNPIDQVKESVKVLLNYADTKNVDPSKIFEVMSINELLYMVRIRQLSPWLLLRCKSFWSNVKKCSQEQNMILESLIRPEYWHPKIKGLDPVTKGAIDSMVSAMGI